ncbi:7384_t:CDS:2 [Ambispora gerdemannii]|uniref:7384_t:CDS:1 n=1 Tax=Ambispora gerdemannii TaxID=144530 RepID=A0A9N9FSH4_9GLOM|nr:7384_t:CDS:2 [Ambispora gerdemannii]
MDTPNHSLGLDQEEMNLDCGEVCIRCVPRSIELTENQVKLVGSKHVITHLLDYKSWQKQALFVGSIKVETTNNNRLSLQGIKKTLDENNVHSSVDIVVIRLKIYSFVPEKEQELIIDMINKKVIELQNINRQSKQQITTTIQLPQLKISNEQFGQQLAHYGNHYFQGSPVCKRSGLEEYYVQSDNQ